MSDFESSHGHETLWLKWAKRLHAIASTGLFFGVEEFDRERYQEVADIASAMLAVLGDVPIEKIAQLFPDYGEGYATPKVDVRGALIRENHILLVKEKSDGLWTLPGGYADVGLSAAQNVVKEVQEEATLDVRAVKLYAVRHKAKHAYRQDARDFYKFFFLLEEDRLQQPLAGYEVDAARFFPAEQLPDLSMGRTIASDIASAFACKHDPAFETVFD